MRLALCFVLLGAALQAAVDGVVMNGTTGKPVAGAAVTLFRLGGAVGMDAQGSAASDAQGKFRFDQAADGPVLLQSVHQGVNYNLMISPGTPASGLTLQVYDLTATPGAVRVVQDVVLLEPAGSQLSVRENVIFQNDGTLTYRDKANGSLRFYVPAAGKDTLRVTAIGSSGMPLEEPALPTGQPDVYKIESPVKPGETRFEVSYTIPFSSPGSFSGRSLQKGAPMRLVVPVGVSLSGDGLELLGQEPQSQAFFYGVKTPDYEVEIQGAGSLGLGTGGNADGGPGIEQILPRVNAAVYPIVGLALAVLALGFALLYRKSATPAQTTQPPAVRGSKRQT